MTCRMGADINVGKRVNHIIAMVTTSYTGTAVFVSGTGSSSELNMLVYRWFPNIVN